MNVQALEFSFMDELREQEEKKRLAERVLPYYPHPRDDNQRLLNYQHDWLEKGDPEAWKDLWKLSHTVARRMIKALAKKTGFVLDRLSLESKVDDAVFYVLRRYREGWYVKRAYLRAIKEGVVHAMWYRTMRDENEISTPDEILAAIRTERGKAPFDDSKPALMVEGMTTAQAKEAVKSCFLFGDELLEYMEMIGDKNE